jgi:hypothetical protein
VGREEEKVERRRRRRRKREIGRLLDHAEEASAAASEYMEERFCAIGGGFKHLKFGWW